MSPLGALHQFVPHLNPGAIATHLLGVQDALRQHGLCSEVFAGAVDPAFAGRARPYLEYGGAVPAQPGDALLYHVALGSPMAGWLAARPETLVLDHHNITPARYFAAWDWRLAGHARKGRRELETLAPRADFGWADSAFNQRELIDAGCRRTAVVPILIDLDDEARAPDPDLLARLIDAKAAGGADWVFVGRVTPNKAQHDIVKAFAAYRRLYDPGARLRLVGDPSPPRYFSTVARFVEGLGLGDAVTLTGAAGRRAIAAAYRAADVFVCLSEHEGFCVPLLEAWYHKVPIVAFAATAVPETLGPAGLLLADKAPAVVATAVHRVLSDPGLRTRLVEAGTARLPLFSLSTSRQRLYRAVAAIEAAGR